MLDPARTAAAVALARLLAARGERDEAIALLEARPGFAAEGLHARLQLEDELPDAFAKIDAGDAEGGIDELLAAMADADADRKDLLRKVVVGVLDELGVEHPVSRESRRKLAAALY